MQAACSDPVKDMVLVEPGAPELRDRDHAVLPIGDFCDHDIGAGAIVGHIPIKATGPPIRPLRLAYGDGKRFTAAASPTAPTVIE